MPRYRLRIAELLRAKGLDTTYKIGQQMNKPPAQASRLLDEKRTQVNEDLVNEMCAFLKCTPGDLWVAVDEKPKASKKKK
jgi:DNA-binding Xre family transcriptional regulator